MDTKHCRRCETDKLLGEFPNDRSRPDGKFPYCKACSRKSAQKYYEANSEDYLRRARDRYYADHEKSLARRTVYRKRNRKRLSRAQSQYERDGRCDPEKQSARGKLQRAVRTGKITKPKNCGSCGAKTEKKKLAGHHEDYARPLDVQWLCPRGHGRHRRSTSEGT